MKKTLLYLLATIPVISMAQNNNFSVIIKIGELNPPAKAYLIYKVGNIPVKDSVMMHNGVAEFKGEIPAITWGKVAIDHDGIGFQNMGQPQYVNGADVYSICLDKGNIIITSKDSLRWATYSGSGSAIQSEFNKYVLSLESSGIRQKRLAIDAYYRSWPIEKKMDTAYRRKMADDPFRKTNLIEDSIRKVYIKEHPDSYVSLQLLKNYEYKIPTLAPFYEGMSQRMKNTPDGMLLASALKVAQITSVGSMAPVFTQNDVNGKPVSLIDFRGKYVLVDFWASWCGPCRDENPNYVKAYHKYKDKNFTFLGVSLDQPGKKESWLAAIKADGLEWPQVSDLQFWSNEVAQLYHIKSIPQNYLIDPTGKIIAENLRGAELEQKLKEILQDK